MGLPVTFNQFPAAAASPSQGTKRRRVPAIVIPFAAVLLANVVSGSELDTTIRLTSSLSLIVCCIPLVIHMWTGSRKLPFMPGLGLVYSIQFVFPVFLQEEGRLLGRSLSVSDPILLSVQQITLVAICCLMVGYYAIPRRLAEALPTLKVEVNGRAGLGRIVALSFMSIMLVQMSPIVPGRFHAFIILAGQLSVFGLVALFYFHLKGQLTLTQKGLLWGLFVPIYLGSQVLAGGVGPIVVQGLALIGAYWLARGAWPWKTMVVFAVIVILLQGVKRDYRQATWGKEATSTKERAGLLYDLVATGFQGQDNFLVDCFRSTMARSDQVSTFAIVVHLTPGIIPYWEGASYQTLYWSLIPRFLYPDKPLKVIGQDFGHRYGLLGKSDRVTSYNTPQLVEFYANFGLWGVVVGMALSGVIGRVLYRVLAESSSEVVVLLAPMILAPLCSIESDFSLIYGGVFYSILATAMVLRLMQTRTIHLPLNMFRLR